MMLEKVKIALRIKHTQLDEDILDTINSAKDEMYRLGINRTIIDQIPAENLILEAVKTYCKYVYATDDKQREGFYNSWVYQLDCLRKTKKYRVM